MGFSYSLSLFLGATIAQAQFNCAKFWPSIQPGHQGTVNKQCTLFPDYPKVIGNVNLTVAYTDEWFHTAFGVIDIIAPTLSSALSDSVTFYSDVLGATLPSDIVIILQYDHRGGDVYSAATILPVPLTAPCQIKTFNRWTDNAVSNIPRAKFTFAHEIYHCIEDLRYRRGGGWQIEGGAQYFANAVYPEANIEWPGDEYDYTPSAPLYRQFGLHGYRDIYSTELFFQSMELFKGIYYIHNWIMDNSIDSGQYNFAEEVTKLSDTPDIADDFFEFAKQFSSQQILDTSQVYIPNLQKVTPISTPLVLNADGSLAIATLEARPFTIQTFQLALDPGQAVLLSAITDRATQRIAYRLAGIQASWLDMPLTPTEAGVLSLPCNDGNKISIEVLFSSTADFFHDDKVQVNMQQLSRDPTCKCAQYPSLRRRGLQDCVSPSLSPTPPPTGTIGSCLGSEATPCFSGPAAAGGGNCFFGVSCWDTSLTEIFGVVTPAPCTAICGTLTQCSTSTESNPGQHGYDAMYEVHCSAGPAPATASPTAALK